MVNLTKKIKLTIFLMTNSLYVLDSLDEFIKASITCQMKSFDSIFENFILLYSYLIYGEFNKKNKNYFFQVLEKICFIFLQHPAPRPSQTTVQKAFSTISMPTIKTRFINYFETETRPQPEPLNPYFAFSRTRT